VDPPTTVTEAVNLLRAEGYTDDVDLQGSSVWCASTGTSCDLAEIAVDHTFRFEGESDPADEAIVLGLRFPGSDVRVILVSAFGPDAEPEVAEFFAKLRAE
jgi:hypothetical protein